GQIYLEYQPIFQLTEQRLVGFEALMRWNHPERGVLEPSMFIPIAEETGLIVPLGNWVLNEACRQMAEWNRGTDKVGLRMSVNVSSLQLTHPDFVAQVGQALQSANLDASALTLEVTESVKAIFKLGQALSKQVFAEGIETGAQLALLRELGCQFGQGYLLSRPVNAERAGGVLARPTGGLAVA